MPSPSTVRRCISLNGSTACPAWANATISTNSTMLDHYPFLQYVSTVQDFDHSLKDYVNNEYVTFKYKDTLGCDSLSFKNTTNLYARYTTSVICAGLVQDSKSECSVPNSDTPPLCAETCAQHARSEESIALNPDLCGTPRKGYISDIRADFTVCSLPVNSLSGDCVTGDMNEPDNCGFANNLPGLCEYCSKSSPNATDSCCTNSRVDEHCKGLNLPEPTATLPPLFTTTAAAVPSVSETTDHSKHHLGRGAIAGAVIGSIVGAIMLAVLPCLYIYLRRKRSQAHCASIFNQPTPSVPRDRKQSVAHMSQKSATSGALRQSRLIAIAGQEGHGGRASLSSNGYEVLVSPGLGGREMRMSAIQTEPLDDAELHGVDAHGNHRDDDGMRNSYEAGASIRYGPKDLDSGSVGGLFGEKMTRHSPSKQSMASGRRGSGINRDSQTPLVREESMAQSQYSDAFESEHDRVSVREVDFDQKPAANEPYSQPADVTPTPKRPCGSPPAIGKRCHSSMGSTSILATGPSGTAPEPGPNTSHLSPSDSSNLATTSASNVNLSARGATSLGNTSTRSEQLSMFKDYYSQEYILPGDKVAVLWAYTPRADDEFTLERGQMLQVRGIWDDGWATGVLLEEDVDEWEATRDVLGADVGNTESAETAKEVAGDVKAFPLVCVCLPLYWRRAVEAETSS